MFHVQLLQVKTYLWTLCSDKGAAHHGSKPKEDRFMEFIRNSIQLLKNICDRLEKLQIALA